LNAASPLMDLALELETVVNQDEYCTQWGLRPNVNYYSALLYHAMGLPSSMYPVMFALGKTSGWLAHFRELRGDNDYPLYQARQIYVGATQRTA
jgi:citrate synthase